MHLHSVWTATQRSRKRVEQTTQSEPICEYEGGIASLFLVNFTLLHAELRRGSTTNCSTWTFCGLDWCWIGFWKHSILGPLSRDLELIVDPVQGVHINIVPPYLLPFLRERGIEHWDPISEVVHQWPLLSDQIKATGEAWIQGTGQRVHVRDLPSYLARWHCTLQSLLWCWNIKGIWIEAGCP